MQAQGERRISIGYRAARVPPSLGRHGLLKTEIADPCQPGGRRGTRPVVSTSRPARPRRSAATTGTGSSPTASTRWASRAARASTIRTARCTRRPSAISPIIPSASFEEVEANCFPGADGEIAYFAISPRHLEACATRTAQVLIEGSYNGILRPGEHYIELRRDFSNLDDVLDLIESDSERARLTEAAYRDIVASGEYTYERLVATSKPVALADAPAPGGPRRGLTCSTAGRSATDAVSWVKVAVWVQHGGPAARVRAPPSPCADARVDPPPHRRHRRRDRGAAVGRMTRRPDPCRVELPSLSGTRRNPRHPGPTRRAMISRAKMLR